MSTKAMKPQTKLVFSGYEHQRPDPPYAHVTLLVQQAWAQGARPLAMSESRIVRAGIK